MSKPTNDHIQFRLIPMPCCNTMICWVNPRRPNYCPECGTFVFRHFPRYKWDSTYSAAWLRVENNDAALYQDDNTKFQRDKRDGCVTLGVPRPHGITHATITGGHDVTVMPAMPARLQAPYPSCRHRHKAHNPCAGKGYCSEDPACND